MYDVIAFPPVALAVNGTDAEKTPTAGAVTVPIVGACGTVVAVTEEDALDERDVPLAFVAVIVNVYDVFEDNPPTTIGLDDPDPVCPALLVTVYDVIADPPLKAGALNATETAPLLNALFVPTSVTDVIVGASGVS
jgi:hypothetical protein